MKQEILKRRALVFGASGFIGRWLIRQLLADGVDVLAAVRSPQSAHNLGRWLGEHGVDQAVESIIVDFTADDLGLDVEVAAVASVTEIYNVAGAFRFGMSAEEARSANVDGSRRVVELAARLPLVSRLVHLSGYRVSAHDHGADAWSSERRASTYARLGAYEASKLESDAVVRARAAELGVPLTIANPSTVIGDSATGETEQQIGLATSVLDLATGNLTALPGGGATFVPVVTVDYLARFMSLLPATPEAAGQAYWILDDRTPALADLLTLVGRHLGVSVPRLRIPVWLIRRLPTALTKADPETLGFMATDRYPTGPAVALAERNGLEFPPVEDALKRWADYLVGHSIAAEVVPN